MAIWVNEAMSEGCWVVVVYVRAYLWLPPVGVLDGQLAHGVAHLLELLGDDRLPRGKAATDGAEEQHVMSARRTLHGCVLVGEAMASRRRGDVQEGMPTHLELAVSDAVSVVEDGCWGPLAASDVRTTTQHRHSRSKSLWSSPLDNGYKGCEGARGETWTWQII